MKKYCRLVLIGLTFIASASAAHAQAPVRAESEQTYQEAVQSLSKGDYFAAQSQLENAVFLDSANQQAGLELLRIYFAQKNFENALPLAEHLARVGPDNENNLIALADVYKATENVDGLADVFSRLIELSPDNPNFYYDKAFALSLKKEFASSLALYETIEKRFGTDDRLFAARKDLYLRQGEPEKAIEVSKNYIAQRPESSQAPLMLANVYLDLEKPQLALGVLNEAEDKFKEEAFIPLTKADAYKMLGDERNLVSELKKALRNPALPVELKIRSIYNTLQDAADEKAWQTAEELSEIVVNLHQDKASAHAVYGDIQLQKGEPEAALSSFRSAVKLDGSMDFVWEQLLRLEVSMNELKSAQQNGREALKQFPTNANILLFTAYAYLLDQQHAEARTYLENALNYANPSNEDLLLEIYAGLGDLYNALDMPAASNVAYDEALALDSTNTYVLNNFAYYLALRKEELDKAASMSKLSNELSENNPSYQDTYAWVLFQQGEYENALQWIEKAIRHSDAPSATLIEHKGDILFKLGKRKEALQYWERALKIEPSGNKEKLTKKIKERIYVE
jgi:tetratricopeptide (TPR) repeat protein